MKKLTWLKVIVVSGILLFSQTAISFQHYVSDRIKAAYVFNFIKYVEWPNEQHTVNFTIGFYGKDQAYYEVLKQMQGMKVRHFSINVIKITSFEQTQKLHLVVLDKSQSKHIKKIAKLLNGQAVLLVSDNAADKRYTMLNFINTDENRLAFELNRYQMLNAKLKVLPDILVLGGTELEIANVLKEMNKTITDSLQQIQDQSSKLEQLKGNITRREKQLTLQQNQLQTQQNKLELQYKKSAVQQETLNLQSHQLKSQHDELEQSKNSFQAMQNNYSQVKNELDVSQVQLLSNIDSLASLKNEIQQKEHAISTLEEKINERKILLLNSERQLATQSGVIQTQYIVLIVSGVVSFAILIILIVIYKSKKIQHKVNQELHANIEVLAEVNLKLSTTQNQLVESEKMAALGQLVTGVAHEINTPVGVCVTATSHLSDQIDLFEKKYKAGKLTKPHLEQLLSDSRASSDFLLRNLQRASELIQNFKQVAVDQSNENSREFELKAYIEGVVQSIYPQFKQGGHNIHVSSNSKIQLNSFPGVLAQIITNLLMNSLHHGFKEKNHGEIFIELSLRNKEVTINFRDNGVGLTNQQKERIFEPFYTTARSTGATGLGMSISYNLITGKLNGEINCLNSSEGAHFRITFPQ